MRTLEQERKVRAVRHDDQLPGTLFGGQDIHRGAERGNEGLVVQLDVVVVLSCASVGTSS